MKKVRVIVIDDSALMRRSLTQILESDSGIEVVGTAVDAYMAREKIKQLNPDVLTLDVEMPKMDGLTFLGNLMRLRPMPVVMVSSLTEKSAGLTLRALDLGAVDFVGKPRVDSEHALEAYTQEIVSKVKAASRVRVDSVARITQRSHSTNSQIMQQGSGQDYRGTKRVIAIGASTGGTEAIKQVLTGMSPNCPGIVIAQHIPPLFSRSFANRMDKCSRLTVSEATDGQKILPGHAYIAPGDQHLEVVQDGAYYRCLLHRGEAVNRHRPSVDVLFESVSTQVGQNAIGVILTGMGRDGAKGRRCMRDAGAGTVAQDEQTSVVWGMPRAAVDEGAAERVLPLRNIASAIAQLISR